MRTTLKTSACAIALLVITGCATTRNYSASPNGDATTVVFIGGANATDAQLQAFKCSFPGSIVVQPEKYFPLSIGANTVVRQIRDQGVPGRFILVGHSWGGLLARTIDANNPGLVAAIVTIATPNGHFRFVPEPIADLVLTPSDSDSKTPLFIIAGFKAGAVKRWWMETDDSDGVVDLKSAIRMGKREIRASVIFEGEHNELLDHPGVIDQVRAWVEPTDLVAQAHLPTQQPVAAVQPIDTIELSRRSR